MDTVATEQIVTTKFTFVNFIISIIGFVALLLLAQKAQPYLEKLKKNKLGQSLDRQSDHLDMQPLYKIFLGFNHSSTDAWLKWILSQEFDKKEEAYFKLRDYLEGEPHKLGAITNEVVKALIAFNRVENSEILRILVIESCKHYQDYKSVQSFLSTAMTGIIMSGEESDRKFLMAEFGNYKNKADIDDLKKSFVEAFLNFPADEAVTKLIVEILTLRQYSKKLKKFTVESLIDTEIEKENIHLVSYAKQVVIKLASRDEQAINEDDDFVVKTLFLRIPEHVVNSETGLFDLLLQNIKYQNMRQLMTDVVCSLVSDKEVPFEGKQLVDILCLPVDDMTELKESLKNRFDLSNEEFKITQESVTTGDMDYSQNVWKIDTPSKNNLKPLSNLDDAFNKLGENLFERGNPAGGFRKNKGPACITGTDEMTKLYVAKSIAFVHSMKFIYIDMVQTLDSQTKMNDFEKFIKENRPCIIYLDRANNLLDQNESIILKRKSADIKNSISKTLDADQVFYIYNIPISSDEIEKEYPYLQERFDKADVTHVYDFKDLDGEEMKKLFKECTEPLKSERIEEPTMVDSILAAIKTPSQIEFMEYLTNYFEISLLAFGKLIPMSDFHQYYQQKEAALH